VIWIPETVRSESSLAAYIKDYLVRSGLMEGNITADCVEALSQALSVYLESTSDRAGFFVEDGNLLVLASRALRSVGERSAATRMLMLGSGFARPVSWSLAANGEGWTLDVARIAQQEHGGLEIIFFRCLHAALEALAETWGKDGHAAVLVLQGAEQAGAAVLGQPVSSRPVQAFVAEVEAACREKLDQLARQYGWQTPPRLLKASSAAVKRR